MSSVLPDRSCQDADVDPLENPVWHALTGPQQTLAEGGERARRYIPDFAPFAALPDEIEDKDWDAFADVLGAGDVGVIGRPAIDIPPQFDRLLDIPGVQMVMTELTEAPVPEYVVLGDDDAPAMRDLVDRTKPGPFRDRTHQLGTYLGVRDGTRLVAMAGERMRLDAYTEISAVCTDPEFRGRGLAAGLVTELAKRIAARSETAILHVAADNTNAIRLYEQLGFTSRREMAFVGLRISA
jgi:ribosomal protein S18 acetylase RimI-like enzyme